VCSPEFKIPPTKNKPKERGEYMCTLIDKRKEATVEIVECKQNDGKL
jgi:hypothetical protein